VWVGVWVCVGCVGVYVGCGWVCGLCGCMCGLCVGVYVSTIKQNSWLEWLDTWHTGSPRHCVEACWFWV